MWKPKLPTTYAEQTHASPYRVIRFAHHRRHRQALEMVLSARPGVLLDYGAGDGHLVAELLEHDVPWLRQAILYEPMSEMGVVLENALGKWISAGRVEIVKHRDELSGLAVDLVLCMGVLEHLPLTERLAFYELCQRKLSSAGRCIVDVPVEVGPTILAKELARILLKGRLPEYCLKDLAKTAVGLKVRDHKRFDPLNDAQFIHYHTGFDYRLLHAELSDRFDVCGPVATPFPKLPAWLRNQEVFFVAQVKGRVPTPPREPPT